MIGDARAAENDPLLEPYLAASDEAAREEALATLVGGHASTIARQVIARFGSSETLSRDDADDVVATVNLRLLRKLRAMLLFESETLREFEGYVVTLAYNSIYDLLRRRFPERTRLKNRIRYLLTHDARFALWTTSAGLACGFAAHREQAPVTLTKIPSLPGREQPSKALEQLFRLADAPLMLDDVISITAEAWAIREVPRAMPAPEPPHEVRHETTEHVRALWREIAALPAAQRAALLLNSRDGEGGNGITPFLFLGIATFDELAAATGFTAEELGQRWDDLPYDDRAIAGLLGITRQQVINLRKCARERLIRRMKKQR
jgi:RNA polymerase sigma factor (sigma-70 family)